MKILHICLGSNFTVGLTYQENYLIEENLSDGHEILVVTNDLYFNNGKICKSSTINKIIKIEENCYMIRLPFQKFGLLTNKIRKVKGLYKIISEFSPNIILFHGICSYELITCKNYIKTHPNVRFIIDTHADQYNSATNILSKILIHKLMYRWFYKNVENYVEKVLFIDENSENFMINNYHVDTKKCVYFPLGGKLKNDKEYFNLRETYRNKLNLRDEIMIFHTGKFDHLKKTIDLIDTFIEVNRSDLLLVIAGIFNEEIEKDALKKINSTKNIIYLNWICKDDLDGYLCACDVYAQPGSQSATFELALCNRCPAIVFPYDNYTRFYEKSIFMTKNNTDLTKILANLKLNELYEMSLISYTKAKENLDYSNIVKKMY